MKPPNYLLHPLRARHYRQPGAAPGTAPGTLRDRPEEPPPEVRVIAYGPHEITEIEVDDLSALEGMRGRWPVLWVNVDGLGHAATIRRLGEIFGLHRLALEDVLNIPQRAKMEAYDDHLFVVARMALMEPEPDTEQVSLFLGHDFVLSLQERRGDCFEPVRGRLRAANGRIRTSGPDYLAYALLDAIVDHYFPVLEMYGDRLEEIEERLLVRPTRSLMTRIHQVKRELTGLRRTVWPMREAVSSLARDESDLVTADTRVYLRDCYDHVVQSMDLVESYRDLASSLTDLYLSSVSNRMNEVMKVLTMFTAIFVPLGFIAGLYGMNFDSSTSPFNMPELHWYWGYPFALTVMAVVVMILVVYFWRKGWIGSD